ncbi:MAG: M3 family metallopeptidase [Cyanobacteria bacterium]|nr:M3 family metallopeptidase [Cyanobacteriota bacterium]MDA1021623.1 M3 family metallopeptidase [Cyanobacteriota bacterium]
MSLPSAITKSGIKLTLLSVEDEDQIKVDRNPAAKKIVNNPERRESVRQLNSSAANANPADFHTRRYDPANPLTTNTKYVDYAKITAQTILGNRDGDNGVVDNSLGFGRRSSFAALMDTEYNSRNGNFLRSLRDILNNNYYNTEFRDSLIEMFYFGLKDKSESGWLNQRIAHALGRRYRNNKDAVRAVLKDFIEDYYQRAQRNRLNFDSVFHRSIDFNHKQWKLYAHLSNLLMVSNNPKVRKAAEEALNKATAELEKHELIPEFFDMARVYFDSPEWKGYTDDNGNKIAGLADLDYKAELKQIDEQLKANKIYPEEAKTAKKEISRKVERKEYAEAVWHSYATNGATLDEASRTKLLELRNETAEAEIQYYRNVQRSKFELVFKKKPENDDELSIADLEALPENFKRSAKAKANRMRNELIQKYTQERYYSDDAQAWALEAIPKGALVVNLEDGIFYPFMEHIADSKLKKKLYIAYFQRGSKYANGGLLEPELEGELDNLPIARKILLNRMKIAQLCPKTEEDHKDYSDYYMQVGGYYKYNYRKGDLTDWYEYDNEGRIDKNGSAYPDEDHLDTYINSIVEEAISRTGVYEFYSSETPSSHKHHYEYGHASYIDQCGFQESQAQEHDQAVKLMSKIIKASEASACQELVKFQKKIGYVNSENNPDRVYPWDLGYLGKLYQEQKLGLDTAQTSQYFELKSSLKGIFKLTEKLFNVKIRSIAGINTWDPDVKTFLVTEKDRHGDDRELGTLYFDLFSRPGKGSGAWDHSLADHALNYDGSANPCQNVINLNLDKPMSRDKVFLGHEDLVTLLHEFGHSLHCVFSEAELEANAGYQGDFRLTEFPSMLFEEFAYDDEALKLIGRHHETRKEIPKKFRDQIKASKDFMKVLQSRGAYHYGAYISGLAFDQAVHKITSATELGNLDTIYDKLASKQKVHWIGRGKDRTSIPASLEYIFDCGYDTVYSSYIMCLAKAKDAWGTFVRHGSTDPQVGSRLREAILSKGDTIDHDEQYRNFKGRNANLKAFVKTFSKVSIDKEKNKKLEAKLMAMLD